MNDFGFAEGLLHHPGLFVDGGCVMSIWDMAEQYIHSCHMYPTDVGHIRTHLFRILAYG